ncbi:MAG: hypothetical protein HYY30_04730 [Chloroflexi bacterium]|nr:hypothetical protein [Chloroflexota bacterium]
MELREYWDILRRRAWLVIGLTLLALIASLTATVSFAAPHKATMRLTVKPQADSRSNFYYSYDEYYAYVSSEYLIDDLIEIIESPSFREELVRRLEGKVASLPDKAIEGKKAHRVLTINVVTGSKDSARLVAETIGALLTDPSAKYYSDLSWQNPTVTIVDPPNVVQLGEGRKYLDIGLRAVLGLIAAVGLAFLLDYLDGTITGAQRVEMLIGLPVLGEIPRRE